MKNITSIALGCIVAAAAFNAKAADPFNYDYLGTTYDFQRIGVDGFSEEITGHYVSFVYSEELKDGLIYQFDVANDFVDDKVGFENKKYSVDSNEMIVGFSLGTHLPITAKTDFIGTAKATYAKYEFESRYSDNDTNTTIFEKEKHFRAGFDLSAGVRWFIDKHDTIDISPVLGVKMNKDETTTYARGRVSYHLYRTMEVYVDMTTYLDDDYRAFGTGAYLYY